MKTVNIKGKEYVEVKERVKYFRDNYENGSIHTSLLNDDGEKCTFKAEVYLGDKCVATGHAYEVMNSSFINKTSYIENCETSAVGRALAVFGIGIDVSMASASEVRNAQKQQEEKPSDNNVNSNNTLNRNKNSKPKIGG